MKKSFILLIAFYVLFATVQVSQAQININFTEGSAILIDTTSGGGGANFELRATGWNINGSGYLGSSGIRNPCPPGAMIRAYRLFTGSDIITSRTAVIVNGVRYNYLDYNGTIIFDSEPMRCPSYWPRTAPLTLIAPATFRGTLRGYTEPQPPLSLFNMSITPLFVSKLNLNGRVIVKLKRIRESRDLFITSVQYEFFSSAN